MITGRLTTVRPSPKSVRRTSQRGTTLIEALVALLVLSIGLLGVAGLQMTSLRNNRSAHLRSQAQVMAYDITDRMRANRETALDGGYNIDIGESGATGTLVGDDLVRWKDALRDSLPSGDGSVLIDDATNVVLITIQWTDTMSAAVQSFTTRTRI
jgi:type IV pilus assembly protein PilV